MTGAPPMMLECKEAVTGAPVIRCSALLDTVFCGDNTEILSGFPAECVDLVVTSPPYDDLRTYGNHSWDFAALAEQLARVLKPGGVIVWVIADATVNGSETGTSMRQALHFKDVCGLNLHDTMVWIKTGQGACGSVKAYWQNWEYCFVLSKGVPKTFNPIEDRKNVSVGKMTAPSGKGKDGLWKYSRPIETKEYGRRFNNWTIDAESNPEHPAPFPEALAKGHVLSWSNPGDLVLDPFAGSGTTLKSAKELNRRYVGIEINEPYISVIKNRLAQDALPLGV